MDLIDRLKIFIKSQNIGQTKFEEIVGFSRGYISNIKTSIGADKLGQIKSKYPVLDIGWLITGEGEMLKSNTNTSPINVDGDLKTDKEMEKEIRRLRASLDLALEKNERLEAELAEYKAKGASSKETA